MVSLNDMMRPRTPMERELHGESEHGSPVGNIQFGPRSSMAEYVSEQMGLLTANITKNEMVWQAQLALISGTMKPGSRREDWQTGKLWAKAVRDLAVELVENELDARRDLGTMKPRDDKSLGLEKPPE